MRRQAEISIEPTVLGASRRGRFESQRSGSPPGSAGGFPTPRALKVDGCYSS